LSIRTNGPYTIEQVHVNGTLTTQLRQGVMSLSVSTYVD
jgi:hypothetical protein